MFSKTTLIILSVLLFNTSIISQTTIANYDFETGLEGWTVGGSDAGRSFESDRACSGDWVIYTKDDDTSQNYITSPTLDFSGYDEVQITFCHEAYYLEDNEGFNIQYYDGVSWSILKTYLRDIDWKNTSLDNHSLFVSLKSSSLTLASNAQIRFSSTANADNEYNYIDNINIVGYSTLSVGPGGNTSDLGLWLKSTDGLGYSDGASVALWEDQGRGSDATVNLSGQEPTYRDNASYNVNFNPVIDFDSDYTLGIEDDDYSYDDLTGNFLQGTSGLFTQDMFVVVLPDTPINSSFGNMDLFCGDEDSTHETEDVTGLGFGKYSVRFTDEHLSFCVGSSNRTRRDGYGVADNIGTTNYNNVGIINARNNSASSQQELYYNANDVESVQNDISDFTNVNNSRFWIGRSEGYEAATNARITEIITFSSRLSDTERAKVETYLAIKYGITLGVNGTSQDYVDSVDNIIWDVSANSGFNYDITGIGRDDDSELNQKQSKSVNTEYDGTGESRGLLTIGLTDIYNTNNENKSLNSTNLNDKEFLVWGNNNGDLDNAPIFVEVDMSDGIPGLNTKVTFTGMERVWKVIENGGDIPKVKLSIPKAAVRNISPPGSYLMFISDNGIFDPTADYRVMADDGTNLTTEYDFDGTKYITFGYAPEVIVERSVYFDGTNDYIDMEDALNLNTTEFTVSAWIKRGVASANKSILSKRDVSYTEGYDFKINSSGKVEMSWGASGTHSITSTTTIPIDEWHQVAVIYNAGSANLYIDGVLDNTETLSAPTNTTQSFLIAAAGKNTPTSHFEGNIDEVRIWSIALSEAQLRYIMNQELVDKSIVTGLNPLPLIKGYVIPTTITNNEINSIPWSNLVGYYPLSIYTFTNTNDMSGNGNQGALRNLDTVDHQTAPLPYVSTADTNWDLSTTWLNGDEQYIPGSASIVDADVTVDWNIVQISSNVDMDNSLPTINNDTRKLLGLFIDNTKELTVNGTNPTDYNPDSGIGNGLTISHYFELNGTIDLEGESQLIQTTDSDLVVGSDGMLEKDQQGEGNRYRYNDWSSPVIKTGTTPGTPFSVEDVLRDGTDPNNPQAISFVGGYDGAVGPPISIAEYWIYKYANSPTGDYNSWQQIKSTGNLKPGEGFLMKGTGDLGSADQNYVFQGKPNNGDITLTIGAGNDYLVGNPYPSVLDANKFITDNGPSGTNSMNGTLYFWEHYGGENHILADYQAGYGTYNYSGGTPSASASAATPHADVDQTGSGAKTPGPYIAVGQGFFVWAETTGGTIEFNNSQRTGFYTEGNSLNSIFMKSAKSAKTSSQENTDTRPKFRIGFDASEIDHRQILLTVDKNATNGVDWGYDAKIYEVFNDDMYWVIENDKYVIQGVNTIDSDTEIPIGIKSSQGGLISIKVDELINTPEDIEVYVLDKQTGLTYDIKNETFETVLEPNSNFTDKYAIVFKEAVVLSVEEDEFLNDNMLVYMNNGDKEIVIKNNTDAGIESIQLYNYLGQTSKEWNEFYSENTINLSVNVATGVYFVRINTTTGTVNKKILVE